MFVFSKTVIGIIFFFFSSRRRHTRLQGDWSSDVCSSDLYVSQAAVPALLERGGGAIVNFASMAVLKPQSQMASYIAAKAAVAGLTRAFAREFRDRGVRVNAVAPGTMKTADNLAQMKDANVRWVELDQLVTAVLFLASDDAQAVTGEILPVAGDG